MATQFNPSNYGIDIGDPVNAITVARKQYVEIVESLKVLNGEKDPQVKATLESWKTETLPAINIDVPDDGISYLAYADAFAEQAKRYRAMAQTEAEEANGYKPNPQRADRKADAASLRTLIESLFGVLEPIGMLPEDFPVKTGKNGDTLPELPKNGGRPPKL